MTNSAIAVAAGYGVFVLLRFAGGIAFGFLPGIPLGERLTLGTILSWMEDSAAGGVGGYTTAYLSRGSEIKRAMILAVIILVVRYAMLIELLPSMARDWVEVVSILNLVVSPYVGARIREARINDGRTAGIAATLS